VIASLAGTVAAISVDSVVLELGGVGYRVYVSPSVIASTQPGGTLKLFTHHVVREDLQALYGFRSAEELGFFGLLLTVTGVGPKVAMAIVGSRPTAELQLAIMQQDQAVLVTIPGIGKKLAERVIFELKEKVAAAGIAAAEVSVAGMPTSESDVVGALQALGYSLPEAREAARHGLQMAGVGASLEDRVKAALRVLVRD
jgi:Holliday junction DNA helicase RuvA